MIRSILRRSAMIVCVTAVASPPTVAAASGSLLITGARVLPMTGPDPVLVDHAIRVEDGSITWVGPSGEAPSADRVVDAAGLTVLPGLIDAHVHLFDETQLPLFPANGVTTVFNLSGTPWVLRWRDEIRDGVRLGPDVFTTGPQVKESALVAVDTEATLPDPDDVPAFVRMHRELGYDFLKIWSSIPPHRYEGLVAECRRQGVRVTGHVPSRVGLRGVLASGQDSIAHVEELLNKFFVRDLDPTGLAAARAITEQTPFTITTTLITYEMIADTLDDDRFATRMARDEYRYLDPALQRLWASPQNDWYRLRNVRRPEGYYDDATRFLVDLTRELHVGGAEVLVGTDAGFVVANIVPGFSIHRELELLVDGGMSELEALRSATVKSGRFLSPETGLGTVVPGAPADLLLLADDPLAGIHATRSIAGVVVRGRHHDRAAIGSWLDDVEHAHAPARCFLATQDAEGLDAAVAEAREDLDAGRGVPGEAALLIAAYHGATADRWDDALTLAELTCELHADSYRSWLLLAGVHAMREQTGPAIDALEHAIALAPTHSLLRSRRAALQRP